MADKSAIEWTDATWNPIVGCSIVSPGCTNCYAMKMAARIEAMNEPYKAAFKPVSHYDGTTKKVNGNAVWTGMVALAPDHILTAPLRWKRGRKIFVNSMGDLFHESIPDEWIDRVFAVMALAPQHTFQVLTKRAERMRAYLSNVAFVEGVENRILSAALKLMKNGFPKFPPPPWPLPNVWLGVSTERQQEADERREPLAALAAAGWTTFVSYEPALGPIDWKGWEFLRWLISGGESGSRARPSHPDWHRAARDFCAEHDISYFFKQWGEFLPWSQFDGAAAFEDHPEQTHFRTMEFEDGHWRDVGFPMWCDIVDGNVDDEHCVGRVGKKRAGRLLDGKEHNEFPIMREAKAA